MRVWVKVRQQRSTILPPTPPKKSNNKAAADMMLPSFWDQVSYLVGHGSLLVDISRSSLLGAEGQTGIEINGTFRRTTQPIGPQTQRQHLLLAPL